MSGPHSFASAFIRNNPVIYDDDAPVSALRALQLQQNLMHLCDMATQHRINWTGNSTADQFLFVAGEAGVLYWSMPFLHTWIDYQWPAGLDIQICGKGPGGSEELSVHARIVPHRQGATPFDWADVPYWEAVGTTTGSTSEELISEIFYPGTTVITDAGWTTAPSVENELVRNVSICLSRLDIAITHTADETAMGLTRVLVREFC